MSFERAARKGKGHRHPRAEEEHREHGVGERPPVPLGMRERWIEMAPVAGVVHEHHARDGEAAKGVDNVLTEPPPRVQFLKFGDYSLDFRLLVWTNQPRRHVQIRSDINYRIAELFRERSIRIPYPTQEFLLKGLPRNIEPNLLGDNEFVATDERG